MPRRLKYGQFTGDRGDFSAVMMSGVSAVVLGSSSSGVFATSYDPTPIDLQRIASQCTALLFQIDTDVIRARIGNNPIMLGAKFRLYSYAGHTGTGMTIESRKVLATGVDWADLSNRYKDVSTTTTWYGDVYWPVPGYDIDESAFDSHTITAPTGASADPGVPNVEIDITEPLLRALQRRISLDWITYPDANYSAQTMRFWWEGGAAYLPYIDTWYMNEVEFLQVDASNVPDISTIEGTAGDEKYYLGATERGVSASPVMGALKNFSGNDIGLIEILDDHPELGDPILESGTGDLFLEYGEAATGAYSQKYTVKIISTSGAGTFEVKAEAWLDYELSLHPSYDADASWQGTPGTLWTAPSGGFSIPAEAWQTLNSEIVLNKEISITVRGDTSDTSYPADSNEQIEIARDNGSDLPDAATWRDLKGRRIKTIASVTIDATTKKLPVRHIDTTDWPTSALAFIGDGTNLHEGAVNSVATATIGSATITGAGLDDIATNGNYKGTSTGTNLYVEIDATGSPDTFSWGIGASYAAVSAGWTATGVSCSTSDVYLADGVAVSWAANTGHTLADYWTIPLNCDYVELSGLTNDSTVYAANSRVGTSLPVENLAATKWGETNAASGASEGQPARIYMDDPSTLGFAAPNKVYIQDLTDPTLYETHTISSVTSTYIALTANLSNDYAIGAFVTQVDVEEVKFHLRLNPSVSTDEELKLVRLAVRY